MDVPKKSSPRSLGLFRWPPYFPRLLSPGGAAKRDPRSMLKELKGSLLYHLAHVLPERPWEPLQEAIYVAFSRRKLAGEYAEFGVFSGRSSVRAYYYMHNALAGSPRRIVAFDSFQGLPPLSKEDRVRYQDFEAGAYACSEEDYRANLRALGVPDDSILTVPGWFSDTCNTETASRRGIGKIAVAHIDCDIYSATLTVLRFLADHMEDGGLIVFDDWGSYRGHPELGQRGALAQFQREHPELWLVPERADAGGSAFVSLHRKLGEAERVKAQQ